MKRIYLSERDAHTLDLASCLNATIQVANAPFPPRQLTAEYVHFKDVQILIDQLMVCRKLARDAGRDVQANEIFKALKRYEASK